VATFVALLRGVNVGGKTLPMAGLRTSLGELGLEAVVTYLQSGNVVFDSDREADTLRTAIERRIAEDFGVAATVIMRTPAELELAAKRRPFGAAEQRLTGLHVVFLDARPAAGAAARLDPDRSPPDRFRLVGREVYLHLPNGAGRSKLTLDYIERCLGVYGTARNRRTLLELLALVRGRAG
jgi:uncharacterized protein (DUF1697 family)